MELQPLVSDAGLWSALPPLLAIVLAIAAREVVFSLFLGICAGLGLRRVPRCNDGLQPRPLPEDARPRALANDAHVPV